MMRWDVLAKVLHVLFAYCKVMARHAEVLHAPGADTHELTVCMCTSKRCSSTHVIVTVAEVVVVVVLNDDVVAGSISEP